MPLRCPWDAQGTFWRFSKTRPWDTSLIHLYTSFSRVFQFQPHLKFDSLSCPYLVSLCLALTGHRLFVSGPESLEYALRCFTQLYTNHIVAICNFGTEVWPSAALFYLRSPWTSSWKHSAVSTPVVAISTFNGRMKLSQNLRVTASNNWAQSGIFGTLIKTYQNSFYFKILPLILFRFPTQCTLMLLGALLSWPRLLSFQSKPQFLHRSSTIWERSPNRANRANLRPSQTQTVVVQEGICRHVQDGHKTPQFDKLTQTWKGTLVKATTLEAQVPNRKCLHPLFQYSHASTILTFRCLSPWHVSDLFLVRLGGNETRPPMMPPEIATATGASTKNLASAVPWVLVISGEFKTYWL